MDRVEGKKIILFDGVCNLCNGAVLWIIRRDSRDIFRFASLQSEAGRELTRERHIDTGQVDSIILIDPGVAYYLKSDAALEIARELKGYGMLPLLPGWMQGSHVRIGRQEHCFSSQPPTDCLESAVLRSGPRSGGPPRPRTK